MEREKYIDFSGNRMKEKYRMQICTDVDLDSCDNA